MGVIGAGRIGAPWRACAAFGTKASNTLTAGFLAEAGGRMRADRVALFLCGDDAEAKAVVSGLIEDAGLTPIDAGRTADAAVMEAPRREGAVYGEEFHADDGRAFLAAQRGHPAP